MLSVWSRHSSSWPADSDLHWILCATGPTTETQKGHLPSPAVRVMWDFHTSGVGAVCCNFLLRSRKAVDSLGFCLWGGGESYTHIQIYWLLTSNSVCVAPPAVVLEVFVFQVQTFVLLHKTLALSPIQWLRPCDSTNKLGTLKIYKIWSWSSKISEKACYKVLQPVCFI